MKSLVLLVIAVLFTITESVAQIKNANTATVKVYGNCGMCKKTIEKAATQKQLSKAEWNETTKQATIIFDSKQTSVDEVLKQIALAGYDSQQFLAPDDAYQALPECCKYEREQKQPVIAIPAANKSSEPTDAHQHHEVQSIQAVDQLVAVFDQYFGLKDELVKTDGNTAAAKAKALVQAINGVKMDQLAMDVHMVWMKVLKGLKEDATHIQETTDISQQRDHFMSLSKYMYDLIKVAKTGTTVYYQFCPMANKGKGANWLSKESGIKNPYYGSQMLTCGKTVETIQQ